jgi:hypothetical protein
VGYAQKSAKHETFNLALSFLVNINSFWRLDFKKMKRDEKFCAELQTMCYKFGMCQDFLAHMKNIG